MFDLHVESFEFASFRAKNRIILVNVTLGVVLEIYITTPRHRGLCWEGRWYDLQSSNSKDKVQQNLLPFVPV
jgi:hypothetical protein